MTINTGIAQPSEEEILALAKFAIPVNGGVNFSNLINNIKNSISQGQVVTLMKEMELIGAYLIESQKPLSEQQSKIWIALQQVLVDKLMERINFMKTPAGQKVAIMNERDGIAIYLRFVKNILSSPNSNKSSVRARFPWACLVDKNGKLEMITRGWTAFPSTLSTISDLNKAIRILTTIAEAIMNNYIGNDLKPFHTITPSTEDNRSPLHNYVKNYPNLFDTESPIESSNGPGLELSDIDSKYVPR